MNPYPYEWSISLFLLVKTIPTFFPQSWWVSQWENKHSSSTNHGLWRPYGCSCFRCNMHNYPLVICYIAIENGHRNSWFIIFINSKWWFPMVMHTFTRGYHISHRPFKILVKCIGSNKMTWIKKWIHHPIWGFHKIHHPPKKNMFSSGNNDPIDPVIIPAGFFFGRDFLDQHFAPRLPSGNLLHSYWKWPIYSGFTHWKWWFSIAM